MDQRQPRPPATVGEAAIAWRGDTLTLRIRAEKRRRPLVGAERQARLAAKRTARGECVACGAPRDPASVRLCARHLRKERERIRRLRDRQTRRRRSRRKAALKQYLKAKYPEIAARLAREAATAS